MQDSGKLSWPSWRKSCGGWGRGQCGGINEMASLLQSSLSMTSMPGIWLTSVVALVPGLGVGGWLPRAVDTCALSFQKGRQSLGYREAAFEKCGRVSPLHTLSLECWMLGILRLWGDRLGSTLLPQPLLIQIISQDCPPPLCPSLPPFASVRFLLCSRALNSLLSGFC